MTPDAGGDAALARPLPGCPARQGERMFSVTAAHFVLDVQDRPSAGGTITEVVGYFSPATDTGTDADAGTGAVPDVVAVAVLELPSASADAQAARRVFASQAGPHLLAQAMRAAITACPCMFPAADCTAMDEDILRLAIRFAAALPDGS